jgi:hypothetical protein
MAPTTAAAQRVPAKPALITLAAPAAVLQTLEANSSIGVADAASAEDPLMREDAASSLHDRLPQPEKKSLGERMLPYAGVGLVLGGLLGYASYSDEDEASCRERTIPGCEHGGFFNAIAGAGLGLGVGALAGYIRERRR